MNRLLLSTATVLLATTSLAQTTITTTTTTCADLTSVSCQACIGAACGLDETGACLETCDAAPTSVSCYSLQNFVGLTAVEICEIALDDEDADAVDISEEGTPPVPMEEEIVGGGTSSSSAAFSETTVGGSETLHVACDALGDSTVEPTCRDCLEAGCVYTQTHQCWSSCLFPDDAACWDLTESGGDAIASICQAAEDLQVDAELCGGTEQCVFLFFAFWRFAVIISLTYICFPPNMN